jgi:hypothetical protein
MCLADVRDILYEKVFPLMDVPENGEKWIEKLGHESCKDGHRLGACIAIDILSGALEPEVLASILNLVDPDKPDARKEFGVAFDKHPKRKNLVIASKLASPPLDREDSYIRILLLRNFIEYYVNPSNPHSFDPADVEDIRMSYFSDETDADFSDIKEWWTGKSGVVWVMPYNDYQELTKDVKSEERGSLVNDALGLGKAPSTGENDGMEMVAVKYPQDFSVGCSQPTTLDAYWIDHSWYFISYVKQDGWGRTQSCSGTTGVIRERVHGEFKNLTRGYTGIYIGVITKNVSHNRKRLLQEACERFISMLSPSTPIPFIPTVAEDGS